MGSTTTFFQIFLLVKLAHLPNYHHSCMYRGTMARVKFSPVSNVHELRAAPTALACQIFRSCKLGAAAATPMDVQELRFVQAATFYMYVGLRPKFDFFSKICYNKRLGVWPAAVYEKIPLVFLREGLVIYL